MASNSANATTPPFPVTAGSDVALSIVASFSLPGGLSDNQIFDLSNTKEAALGLPDGVDAVKPPPGSYTYSGMHDHGPMIPPKEGGGVAALVGFANAARKASDKYLTEIIEEEKAAAAAVDSIGAVQGGGKGRQKKGEKRKAELA
eukprot:CAMPEP_0113553364 /NCGR_PEP_ID=MMETSP0015_2-20120614/15573_1 /TAXON_ID=2838 /ORGANISM="Odontella" /LENGTH=144 /DNA_ID=CAMNT_0000454427 /DNA_START=15 /DNA_END=449 /DNA_ORIENTATION=- /assembly_acc=CAM_ASM_000160